MGRLVDAGDAPRETSGDAPRARGRCRARVEAVVTTGRGRGRSDACGRARRGVHTESRGASVVGTREASVEARVATDVARSWRGNGMTADRARGSEGAARDVGRRARTTMMAWAVVTCAMAIACAWMATSWTRAWVDVGVSRVSDGDARVGGEYVAGRVLTEALAGTRGGGRAMVTSLWLTAKVLACASAACAVAAIASERGEDVETEVKGAEEEEEPREKRSPRTREPKSLEDVLRAKEAAKERKRRVREEQELLAKQEEEERAEIARLVVLERAKREAAAAKAAAEELERKKREEEETEKNNNALDKERTVETKDKVALALDSDKQREQAHEAQKKTEKATATISADGKAKKPSSPPNGRSSGNSSPRKQHPVPPKSTGLTLRKIPVPRPIGAVKPVANGSAETPRQAAPPPAPRVVEKPRFNGVPPLPQGPPPASVRIAVKAKRNVENPRAYPPLPPMASLDEVRRMDALHSRGVAPPAPAAVMLNSNTTEHQPVSPRSQSLKPPPGFEMTQPAPLSPRFHAAAPPTKRTSFDQWDVVDSTIQSFLASTTGLEYLDDDPFTYAARGSSATDSSEGFGDGSLRDIFARRASDVDGSEAPPPLPPTPHPEVLAGMFE